MRGRIAAHDLQRKLKVQLPAARQTKAQLV